MDIDLARNPRLAETFPLVGHLNTNDRIVVTGASGWMGRSLLHELEAALGDAISTQVLAVGSRNKTVRLGSGRLINIRNWDHDIVASWQPTACAHLAYLTREHVREGNLSDYIRANLVLTSMAARLQQLPGIRAFITTSSGAAATVEWSEALNDRESYGFLKRLDETFFAEEGRRLGVATVIARTWSVSGPYCTKPELFAFSDLVRQAWKHGTLEIRAPGEVWRRYVDAGQYLAICLRAALEGESETVDSAGPLIEIRELALAIAQQVPANFVPPPVELDAPVNRYATDSHRMEELARSMSCTLLTLAEQISWTGIGVTSGWGQ